MSFFTHTHSQTVHWDLGPRKRGTAGHSVYPEFIYPGQYDFVEPNYGQSKVLYPRKDTAGGKNDYSPPTGLIFGPDGFLFSPEPDDASIPGQLDRSKSLIKPSDLKRRQRKPRPLTNYAHNDRIVFGDLDWKLDDDKEPKEKSDVGEAKTISVGTDPRFCDREIEPKTANASTNTYTEPHFVKVDPQTPPSQMKNSRSYRDTEEADKFKPICDRGIQVTSPLTTDGNLSDEGSADLTDPLNALARYNEAKRHDFHSTGVDNDSADKKEQRKLYNPNLVQNRRRSSVATRGVYRGEATNRKASTYQRGHEQTNTSDYQAQETQQDKPQSLGLDQSPEQLDRDHSKWKGSNEKKRDFDTDDLKELSAKHYLEKKRRLRRATLPDANVQSHVLKTGHRWDPRKDMTDGKTEYVIKTRSDSRHPSSTSQTSRNTSSDSERRQKIDDELLDHFDEFNIQEEYEGGDIYLCYLVTESGAAIGPMRLDIDDIEMGLPGMKQTKTTEDEEGLRNRQTGSHGLNEFSSRSHSMLTVTIDSEYPDPDDENLYITKRGKLSFVDLAGSEKVKDQNLGAGVLSESNSINKSLLVLGNCISHLGDSKRRHGHIPYRDSKLTKLLADSLGGNGVTLMITCITPSSYNVTETMNTLRYASRAKKIKTKPAIKMDPREKLILSLKREIKILRNENHYLRQQLEFPAKPKGQLQKENDEKFMKFIKEQQQKESGLNEMLQEYMVENEALRGENSDLHSTRDRIRREQQLLYRENEKLMKRVEELERVVSQSPSTWQQAAAAHPQYEGYRQSDITSPRMSPAGNPRKASVPPRLPAQDFPHPDPSRLPGNSPRNALPPGVPPHPMRPPHRLSEPVIRAAPGPYEVVTNGGPDSSGIPQRIGRPIGQGPPNAHIRQISPTRPLDRRVSQVSNSDSIRDMNERLRLEVLELEGEIQQQHQLTQRRSIPRQQQNGTIR
ncbi:uncharacterized protein LOC121368954 isoform X2 [Gigantopelta aegis]|uniref:uncharacterized protein LOC121368954 isoform X2 n=1 Tax=Gigantopelta aegis TaxID=1735272 RepID=UPI001B88D554|nr:uncharacterized protein LOC121368954 isoform X2 [Gigantopelta aegis]